MNANGDSRCAVCGHQVDRMVSGYLLTARVRPPRIAILHWNQTLAAREEARPACSPEHVLEMVAHWMVSGSLDLNFTRAVPHENKQVQELTERATTQAPNCQPIGEVVINRESVRKLVAGDPEALASVLDSLLEALLRDRNVGPARKPALSTAVIRRASIA